MQPPTTTRRHHHLPSSFSSSLIAVVVASLFITNVAGEVATACYDGANRTLTLQCGRDSLIRITRTFYGWSSGGQCRYHPHDCTLEATLPPEDEAACVGQSSCSLPLRWVETGGVLLPQCQRRSNYFQVEYQCVPKSELQDMCQTSQLTSQRGYLVTPQYPLPFNQRLSCTTTIVVKPNQKLKLNLISMELKAQGKTDCADWLYFNDKFHSLTLCGRRTNTWYSMHSNFLHIELQSLPHSTSQGFWLYYEADPLLPEPPSTPAPTLESTRPQQQTPRRGGSILMSSLSPQPRANSHPATPIPVFHNNHDDTHSPNPKSLPFAAIAGGVIGTLSLVLIVLLMLLLIKWLRERHYFNNDKFLEIRNPAFRSSGDFHDANPAPPPAYYN